MCIRDRLCVWPDGWEITYSPLYSFLRIDISGRYRIVVTWPSNGRAWLSPFVKIAKFFRWRVNGRGWTKWTLAWVVRLDMNSKTAVLESGFLYFDRKLLSKVMSFLYENGLLTAPPESWTLVL